METQPTSKFGRGFAHRKDTINGIAIHSVTGGDGPAVMLLHGWPQTSWEWRRIMPSLAERFTVIAPDLRGFGDSAKPPPEHGYDVASVCADLIGLLDRLQISSVRLIGHDLGGLVAYAMSRLHPKRVERLALADAPLPVYGLEVPGWSAIEKRLWHLQFHKVPYLPEALITGRERVYLSWHFAQSIQNVPAISAADIDEYVRCYAAPGGLSAGFAFSRSAERSAQQVKDTSRDKLKIPLLFFGGETSLGNAFEKYLGQIAEDAKLFVVPRSGHWMPEENPTFLLEKLTPFLA
jgi:pimeloyl-ACP methyl ester carboxylesterase